jgi:hypothetical protein
MGEQLPEVGREVPRVVLAQRVLDKIVRGALLYPEPETGEALIGLVVPHPERSEPDIYILDTIGPGEQAVREWGMFEQGDDWQADVFNWLHANWEAFRELRRPSYGNALAAKWDVPLMHVGDWHKQPGDMIEPSGGDAETARYMIADAETPVLHLVAPIVTMYRIPPADSASPTAEPEPLAPTATDQSADEVEQAEATPTETGMDTVADEAGPVLAPDEPMMPLPAERAIITRLEDEGWIVRVDFWYMSKRHRRFIELKPAVWPNDRLPGLPPIAWHLAQPRRFNQEHDLLVDDGYAIDVVRWDADGRPPFEICFSVYKPGTRHVLLLVTPADYPAQRPAVRVAPLVSVDEDEDVFEKLYVASEPVLDHQMPEWEWDSKRTLVELARHFEQTLAKEEDGA